MHSLGALIRFVLRVTVPLSERLPHRFLFLFKGIHIAGDIEIKVVFLDLGELGHMGVFFLFNPGGVGLHDLVDIHFRKVVHVITETIFLHFALFGYERRKNGKY
jgi:hypothetical protein